jgi:hypothetical protein
MTPVSELDPVEALLQISVQNMKPNLLMSYIQESFKREFNYPLPTDREKDLGIVRRLCRVYKKDAGTIIQYFFHHYHGQYQGQRFSVPMLSSGWQWFTDRLLHEIKERERFDAEANQCVKLLDGNEFLRLVDSSQVSFG